MRLHQQGQEQAGLYSQDYSQQAQDRDPSPLLSACETAPDRSAQSGAPFSKKDMEGLEQEQWSTQRWSGPRAGVTWEEAAGAGFAHLGEDAQT